MPRFVAFLRALNVGGHGVVKMEALKRHFEKLGFTDVETFIASGNVVFSSKGVKGLDERIAAALERELGYPVATFVRTVAELADAAAHEPFAERDVAACPTYLVGFLSKELDADAARGFRRSRRTKTLPRPRTGLLVALEAPPGEPGDHGPRAREGPRPADDTAQREHDPEDGGAVRMEEEERDFLEEERGRELARVRPSRLSEESRDRARLECPMPSMPPPVSLRPGGARPPPSRSPLRLALSPRPRPAPRHRPRLRRRGPRARREGRRRGQASESRGARGEGRVLGAAAHDSGADTRVLVHVLDRALARPDADLRFPEAGPEDLPPRVRDRGRGEEEFSVRKEEIASPCRRCWALLAFLLVSRAC